MVSHRSQFVALGVCCLVLAGAATQKPDEQLTREQLKARLQTLWNETKTISFQSEEWRTTPDGAPQREIGVSHTTFKLGPEGRRAVVNWYIYPDRKDVITDFRDNGTKRYVMAHDIRNRPDAVARVEITRQPETHDNSPTGSTTAMTVLAPRGRPLGHWINDRSEISTQQGANGESHVVVVNRAPGREERWELDPKHDWLPVLHRITFDRNGRTEVSETRVTEFSTDNGRWFPLAGKRRYDDEPGETHYTSFRVADLQFNREIPPSAFEMPDNLARFIRIVDRTK